ncbi:MAG: peptide ABC transporter substrate-binding protein [Spirochaetia bacterium]|jgi:peptide/nickel transport system substrate-binding protein/oligopeptide transport system substrate-binding protein|nr:peptide ABC transporter substrate-binding protein [Spirochaetia bacterium]
MRLKKIVYLFFSVLLFLNKTGAAGETIFPEKLVMSFPPSLIEYNPLYTYSSTEAQLYTAIYEGLVSYDPYTLKPVPAAAEKWVISSDKTEFIFSIRKDAYYWDGTNITAQDFRSSWLKMLSPGDNSEYAFLLDVIKGAEDYRKGIKSEATISDSAAVDLAADSAAVDLAADVGIIVLDKYRLKVILNTPAEHFLKILCHHSFVPVHPAFLDKRDWSDLASAPGNGPYYILKKSSESITLVKNQLYWDEKNVEIPVVEILFIDDPDKTTKMFNNKKIQWATGNFSGDLVEDKKNIIFNPSFATNYFFFNCRIKPWDNPSVRNALLLTAPLEGIRNKNFVFFPAASLVPPIPDYPEVSSFEKQDRDKAVQLFNETGEKLPDEIVIKIPESLESKRVASLMKESWEEFLHIPVKIETVNYQSYYQELKKNDFTLGTVSWIGDFPDPLTFLQMWTSGSKLNDAGFSDSSFDDDIKSSLSLSGKKRYEFLSRAEKKLLDSGVILPVSYSPSINLINTEELAGWYPNPIDIHPMKHFKFRKTQVHPALVKASE